jgi:hypothetical protein
MRLGFMRQPMILGLVLFSALTNAVSLSPNGVGQVLLFPYYTVNGDNTTIISVVNSTAKAKVLRLRAREAINGREVFSINLYLAPFDTWNAGILALAPNAGARLATQDASCTVPRANTIAIVGAPFGDNFLRFSDADYAGANNDSGPSGLTRTREGSVEIFELATVKPRSTTFEYISYRSFGSLCPQIEQTWQVRNVNDAIYARFEASNFDFDPPTGGIYGQGAIVDVQNGSYINYDAIALNGFTRTVMHTYPGNRMPDLSDADPISEALVDGRLVRSTWTNSAIGTGTELGGRIDAVSSVLAATRTSNEFNAELASGARTEWVINSPTRMFYTDARYVGPGPDANATKPFESMSSKSDFFGQAIEFSTPGCEKLALTGNERNGQALQLLPSNPAPPGELTVEPQSLCYQTGVIAFNQRAVEPPSRLPSAILGSTLAKDMSYEINTQPTAGWMSLRMDHINAPIGSQVLTPRSFRASTNGHVYAGLPVIGFSAVVIENRAARPNLRASYGGAYPHVVKQHCSKVGNSDQPCD